VRAYSRWLTGLIAIYVVTAVAVGVQHGVLTHENTFAIFRASFPHLLHGRDLYAAYPDEYRDLYKYSPTFALLFAPFALLPFAPGLILWNALNAGVLALAIARLLPPGRAALALGIAYLETVGALQYSQSNALIAGLIILAFLALEADRAARAGGLLAVGACVKIFPLTALLLAVPRRRLVRTSVACAAAMAVLAMLPLVVTDWRTLLDQYRSWRAITAMETQVHAVGLNGGVMQAIRMWTGVSWPNWPIQLAGTALLVSPVLLGRARWDDAAFRLGMLASVLLYVVLFNHRAEAPSYVIAMAGVGIWYAANPRTPLRTALVVCAVLVVSVSSTQLIPHAIRRGVVERYAFKTAPILVIWLVMQWELVRSVTASWSGTRHPWRHDSTFDGRGDRGDSGAPVAGHSSGVV
jgi:Glycosyltransferase family 87